MRGPRYPVLVRHHASRPGAGQGGERGRGGVGWDHLDVALVGFFSPTAPWLPLLIPPRALFHCGEGEAGFGEHLGAPQAPVLGGGSSRFGTSARCGSSLGVSPRPGGLLGADCGSPRLDQDPQQAEAAPAPAPASAGKCSRTFISFSDDETFERFFPKAKPPRLPVREICPVTHKPAVYRDPITDIPYSNIRAFKIIREAYKKYIKIGRASCGKECRSRWSPYH